MKLYDDEDDDHDDDECKAIFFLTYLSVVNTLSMYFCVNSTDPLFCWNKIKTCDIKKKER